ncbi:MAG: alpha-ketoacid dehydrogenase subunit beta [Candidatus Helarchaeota archaeon]|nr:alpha-ketoacid dehydrogenase subunit beta [Candidatus Helarchaeota archaeon]
MGMLGFDLAIRDAIKEEMERDEKVFIMGEDIAMPFYNTTRGLIDIFGPERIRCTPISESAFIGAALGAAATGLRPIAEIMFADFCFVCMDQIVNQIAKFRYMTGGKVTLPLVIRFGGMGAGEQYAAQHSTCVEALFMHIPGLKIITPSTPYDAKGLLKTAIRDDNPVLFFEHKRLYFTQGEVPEKEYTIPMGQADIKREGTDVTLIATMNMVPLSLIVADKLQEMEISAEVIDPRTLVPLDKNSILKSVKKTGRVVIIDEGVKTCGVAAELMATIVEEDLASLKAIKRVTTFDIHIPFSKPLEQFVIPSEARVIEAVQALMK